MSTIAVELENMDLPENQSITAATEPCANCGEPVGEGEFCKKCGQENTDKIVPLKEFIFDILGEFITFDTKVTRSLLPLLAKPGFLTNEYIAGKRADYLLPSRIYVIISFLFFLLIQNFFPFDLDGENLEFYGISSASPALLDKVNSELADIFPPSFFVVIPFFAVFLKLLYVRQKRLFVEHLIFSFHVYSALVIGLIPGVFFSDIEFWGDILVFFSLFVVPPVYLYFSIRRVYKQSIFISIVKAFLTSSAFAILYVGTALVLVWWIISHG